MGGEESLRRSTQLCAPVGGKEPVLGKIRGNVFALGSFTAGLLSYVVDMEEGICSCVSGCVGRECKHQRYIREKLGIVGEETEGA